ncbi:MAG: hypothetical protein R3218_10810, partial [Christiangramia sp.]|nr:hypothetical protein [Christiangramia sp.]
MRYFIALFVMALVASCANSEKSSNPNSEEIVLEINYEKPQDSVVLKTDPRYKLYEQADTTLHLQTSTG